MFIKICGITRREDFEFVAGKGVSCAGFVAYPKSKRYVSAESLGKILMDNGKDILKAGVFVNAGFEDIMKYVDAGIDIIQLHGNEPPLLAEKLSRHAEVWRALRPKTENDIRDALEYPASKILIDAFSEKAPGGTGDCADWDLAALAVKMSSKPVLLAGGLNISNIEAAVSKVRPAGVDICSGVESAPGIKDKNAIENILAVVRKVSVY